MSHFNQSEALFKQVMKASQFFSHHKAYPHKIISELIQNIRTHAEEIPDISMPVTILEVHQSELKRRLLGEAFELEMRVSGKRYDFDTVIDLYHIPKEDINGLKDWLNENKDLTHKAIERLFLTTEFNSFDNGLATDIPRVRKKSEAFATDHIKKYHSHLGALLQSVTNVGSYLKDIDAVPTTKERSYFHFLNKRLAISIDAICYLDDDGSLNLRTSELLRLYAHEGMGHALNQVITAKNENNPFFLTNVLSKLVKATAESVALYYEDALLEDLKGSIATQRKLGIYDEFEKLYQQSKDIALLRKYRGREFQYAITVLADKDIGTDPQDNLALEEKARILSKIALDPGTPMNFLQRNRYNFDSKGNVNPALVVELIYCAQSVNRVLDAFAKNGKTYESHRSEIDLALLNGYWTPTGFEQNGLLIAQKE